MPFLDRLVKLWDLERGVEKCTLGLHPNNVLAVKFIPGTDVALSVSMSTVRLWDLRMERCIRILLSSGLAVDGEMCMKLYPNICSLILTLQLINLNNLETHVIF